MNQQLFTTPPKLTERQNVIYQAARAERTLTPAHAGKLLHQHQRCPWCSPDAICQYAEANGREVLEALKKKGLVRRDRHHIYRPAEATVSAQGDFPEGY